MDAWAFVGSSGTGPALGWKPRSAGMVKPGRRGSKRVAGARASGSFVARRFTASVWVIYAFVLHSPINPRLRGRRAAILSIVGCVLMLGLIVTVQLVTRR